ncbi:chorismate mutase [Thermosynechococcaceae cyanobacterium BACA0444]|uniref:chorismate mutase n=1 Tax=Pseudocalidococcus azoricus BACA0444 TaxID=2918990 RepID=A0AAE4JWB2_9CYAN|nr:chorismate mutase [Pseudocalidococcus azoricus]MDS3859963.1 chorismate mutase [Pseudocalidococcus azoricus BACA0444]
MEDVSVVWRVRAIRGATTAANNTIPAIREAVQELLDEIEAHNQLDLTEVISVTFSVTRDLDRIFPAAVARERPKWQTIPLLDVQQMYVEGGLERCIRCLIYFNTPQPQALIQHIYLRQARDLRPDLALTASYLQASHH